MTPVDTGALREAREAASKISTAIASMQGKKLGVAFQDEQSARHVGLIIENAGRVARALPALLAEVERRRADEAELVGVLEGLNEDGCYACCRHYGIPEGQHSAACEDIRSLLAKVKDSGSLSPRSIDNRDRSST